MPEHIAYHDWNRSRDRLAGQTRIRVRHKRFVTDWIDLLMLSEGELRELLKGGPWKITETIGGEGGRYTAVIDKA